MSNGSPTAYLLWAILSCVFLAFLVVHLWAYDRFNCLKWDSGRQPGAFKRVMTYSYLATLPLLVVFSVATTTLKFKEGYMLTPYGSIIPKPISLWSTEDKHWLLPMYFILSIAWSLELVTHLEELAFWLFLLHQGPGKRNWFHSWEFRTWYTGSIVAVLGMPLTTLVSRREIEKVQAWIFLVGSSAGTSTTLAFLYILFRFPGFIHYVKEGGAEPDVVVRLATFYHLNRIRVMFRFLFTVPLLIIAIDALESPYPVIGNSFALDFLLMVGGIGCFISSAITLLIFFPRSMTQESGYKAKIISPQIFGKVPIPVSSPLPDYYGPDIPGSPTSEVRMGAFRYPTEPAGASQTHPIYVTESQAGRCRTSAESTSPGYESDAESIAMASPTRPSHQIIFGPQENKQHPQYRHDSSQTAASRPTSGGRSDDTVWDRKDDSLPHGTRRRHSDGPIVYNRHQNIVAACPGSVPVSEEGHRSTDHERETGSSQLHPYLINFTSPIDLLDDIPPEREDRNYMV